MQRKATNNSRQGSRDRASLSHRPTSAVPATRDFKIVQKNGVVVGILPIKEGAESRLLTVDGKNNRAILGSARDLFHELSVEPINRSRYNQFKAMVTAELDRSLSGLFEIAKMRKSDRQMFVESLSERILTSVEVTSTSSTGWTGRIDASRRSRNRVESSTDSSAVLPLPTSEELARDNHLYSQAQARLGRRAINVIDHLRAVWMPWIEAGVLTRPDLRRDPSLYVALSKWTAKDGNDLRQSLGHDIPKKSELIDAYAERARSSALPDAAMRSLANRRSRSQGGAR